MKNKFSLSTACLSLMTGFACLSGGTAHAQQEMGSLVYYGVTDAEINAHYNEWRVFLEYNLHREQCQHYQDPPAGYVMKGCNVYRVEAAAPAVSMQQTTTTVPMETITPHAGTPTVSSYTVYFDWDKSNVRPSEKAMLENAANAIQQNNPASVTVSGYTDRSGSENYNQGLSERRAQTVTNALESSYGIPDSTIHQEAYGETHTAVETADGVREQANRRVVIEFNR
jgi:outer membrane protein OmpA-like peptidoglycan-associated protein